MVGRLGRAKAKARNGAGPKAGTSAQGLVHLQVAGARDGEVAVSPDAFGEAVKSWRDEPWAVAPQFR